MNKNLLTAGLLALALFISFEASADKPNGGRPAKAAKLSTGPIISYTNPTTFTVGMFANPLVPSSSGVYLAGYNNAAVTLGSGFNPYYIAMDAAGNIYVADQNSASIKKIPAGGGTPTNIGSGLVQPKGVAVDAAGNVYAAETGSGHVKMIPVGGGSPSIIGSGIIEPIGLAVDAAGNVYVTDLGDGTVKEILAGSGFTNTVGVGFISPNGIAIDPIGNIYVSDFGAQNVVKINHNNGPEIIIASGFSNSVAGLALDGAGNIYVADQGSGALKVIPAAGGPVVTLNQNVTNPRGIIVDAAGNLYFSDVLGTVSVTSPSGGYFISPALPDGLSFNRSTGVIAGTPTVATPATNYVVTAYNPNGGTSFAVNITTVLPPPPVFSYTSPKTYIAGTAISTLSPSANGVGSFGYDGKPSTIGSGFSSPYFMTLDASGNLYVADYINNAIKKVPAGGGAPVQLGGLINQPRGVAIDAAGNIYAAETGSNDVKKIPAGGGAAVVVGSGFNQPINVACDAAGNVYVSDFGSGTIKEIMAAGGSTLTIGTGFTNPTGLALDAAGNIYVADYGTGQVSKMPPGGGPPVVLATGFSSVLGVTVDAVGNIYVADQGNGAIKMVPAGGGAIVTFNQNIGLPRGLVVDPAGKLYYTDALDNNVNVLTPTGGYFLSNPLPVGLNFNNSTGAITGTPTNVSPPANYKIAAYNVGGGSSTLLNLQVRAAVPATLAYATPKVYTVGTAITALTPSSSGVAAAAYSGTPIVAVTGLHTPWGVAVDAAGNIFEADNGTGVVKEIPVGGSAPFNIGTGFNTPYGVAVDAQGNVYVCDYGHSAVKKIPAGGGPPITLGSGFANPTGVAVDKKGNIYVADYGNSTVTRIPADNSTAPVPIGSGFSHPIGIAIDSTGNIYVADFNNNAVKKIPADGSPIVSLGSGYNGPAGVAVDASGNVFVTDYIHNQLKEVPANGGGIITIASGFNLPADVAVSTTGVLYVSDRNNNLIKQINPVGGYYLSTPLPAGLSFSNSTGVISGTPTAAHAATDYTVTAYNSGGPTSAPLNITVTASTNALLTKIGVNSGTTLTTVAGPGYRNYTTSVPNSISTITVTATAQDAGATIKINGVTTASGTPSAAILLAVGNTVINTVVTAADGVTTKTYIITVTRAGSNIATLSRIVTNTGVALTQVSGPDYRDYTISVPNSTSTMTVTPTTTDVNATVKVNGVTVASGTASAAIPLAVGTTTVNTVVTAQDGVTTNTYSIAVTRPAALSNNALLTKITTNSGVALTSVSGPDYKDYTLSVPNSTSSITITPITQDANATVKVNSVTVASGTASAAIPLAVGNTVINTVVTAQDGVTTKTYGITVTRASMMALYHPKDSLSTDGIVIHEGVTPNGDGINDVFVIDGLTAYPDNKVTIMSRSGAVIYEATGYDNQSKFFDGHSNKNGTMQKPGTYFYSLQYNANGKPRYTTGFIVLKY